MKGFELSERFFQEIGLPAIEQQLPECVPRLAVGVGLGSQAHKYDDDVSRDHGWGPGFNGLPKTISMIAAKEILDTLI